jgi:hypothetical protein
VTFDELEKRAMRGPTEAKVYDVALAEADAVLGVLTGV